MARREKSEPAKLPDFQSRQEMAEFWDTHDFTDYTGEFKPVKIRFAKKLSEGITIRRPRKGEPLAPSWPIVREARRNHDR